jgi:hypothetical protein
VMPCRGLQLDADFRIAGDSRIANKNTRKKFRDGKRQR